MLRVVSLWAFSQAREKGSLLPDGFGSSASGSLSLRQLRHSGKQAQECLAWCGKNFQVQWERPGILDELCPTPDCHGCDFCQTRISNKSNSPLKMNEAEEGNSLSVFVWDHTNLDLGKATGPYRALFASDSVPTNVLPQDHDFAEFEIARDARRVLETKMPESLAVSEDEADVVFVALWPYGLCMLNVSGQTVGMDDWQTEKGILAKGTCPEVQDAYAKVVKSKRFARRDGRDFAFIADKVTKMLENWNPGWAYKELVNRSILIGVEERRLSSEIGRSRHLPVPYYVDPEKWYVESNNNPKALLKENFIAYWGSEHVGEHCPACIGDNAPAAVRGGVIDQLKKGCAYDSRPCKIITKSGSSDRNTFMDDEAIDFEKVMQNSIFCPVPRGDSAATKRFYCAPAC